MEWKLVRVDQTSGKKVPFVSIGRGMLDFNAVAASLVKDEGQYRYVQLFEGKEKGKAVIAVKFLTEPDEESIPIKRKIQNGKLVKGMTIVNKGVVEEKFGKDGANKGMVRRKVELIGPDMLKIVD